MGTCRASIGHAEDGVEVLLRMRSRSYVLQELEHFQHKCYQWRSLA